MVDVYLISFLRFWGGFIEDSKESCCGVLRRFREALEVVAADRGEEGCLFACNLQRK